jgi:hypothetical protein
MDLSDGHPDSSNTQRLHGSLMDHGSAPLDRTSHSSQSMATEKACMEQSVQNIPKACCTDLCGSTQQGKPSTNLGCAQYAAKTREVVLAREIGFLIMSPYSLLSFRLN